MSRKKLDLSSALAPLENELYEMVKELLNLKKEDSPLFDAAVEAFITKHGATPYQSLDELLEQSLTQKDYTPKETVDLALLIKDLF